MNTQLYTVMPDSVHIRFTHIANPIDKHLSLLGELIDDSGKRFWAAYGQTEAIVLKSAAAWLDNCHGRAGHTPTIAVDGDSLLSQAYANSLQKFVQVHQSAQLR